MHLSLRYLRGMGEGEGEWGGGAIRIENNFQRLSGLLCVQSDQLIPEIGCVSSMFDSSNRRSIITKSLISTRITNELTGQLSIIFIST